MPSWFSVQIETAQPRPTVFCDQEGENSIYQVQMVMKLLSRPIKSISWGCDWDYLGLPIGGTRGRFLGHRREEEVPSFYKLPSHFSRVWLCATPQTAAHQAPPSLGFSRQEHWSGLPFPSPMHESEKWKEVAQLYPTLRDPMDCSLPGSSIHRIFQARVLEWGAIAFSVL